MVASLPYQPAVSLIPPSSAPSPDSSHTLTDVNVLSRFAVKGATRNDWFLDASVAGMGLVALHVPFLVGLIVLVDSVSPGPLVIAAVTGALVFVSIVLRHHYPLLFFAVVLLLIVVQVFALPYATVSWLVVPVAVFDTARLMAPRIARICLVIALVVTVPSPVRWILPAIRTDSAWQTVMILAMVTVAGAIMTAYSIGRRGYDVAEARSRQEEAEHRAAGLRVAEQAAHQRALETQVRTGISREVHDIVAHSIAVMVVQAEGGLAQIDRAPQRTRQALETISDSGHEALQEMRRIVRLLRSDVDEAVDGPLGLASAPRLDDLPALIEKSNATLQVRGTPSGLTPSLEMTIYRVIQEGLTNSLKHAGAAADPRVRLVWRPSEVLIMISNKMTRQTVPDDHRGTGLIGMAERVQALDGTLTAGPDETGGFEVCAQIPLKLQNA